DQGPPNGHRIGLARRSEVGERGGLRKDSASVLISCSCALRICAISLYSDLISCRNEVTSLMSCRKEPNSATFCRKVLNSALIDWSSFAVWLVAVSAAAGPGGPSADPSLGK